MRLRPYQAECVDAVFEQFEECESTLVVKATGLGKTVTFSEAVRRHDGGSIVLAHRKELIDQAANHLRSTGIPCTIEMGEDRACWDQVDPERPVIVSSVQTLSRPGRQRRLSREMQLFGVAAPSLWVIDEAHHATASTYGACLEFGRGLAGDAFRLLGVTATPNRADEAALGRVFQSVAYRYEIADAIPDGWLVPIAPHAVTVEDLDFSKVSGAAGDLNEAQLEAILTEEKHLHDVAVPAVDLAGERSTLVFCVTVRHAELLSRVFDRYFSDRGLNAKAAFLSGETPPHQRQEIISLYKAGKITCLCNCALFLEGFDAPNTEAVVMARPTKSLSLYTQVVGRGTRPLPGTVDGLDTAEERRRAIAASAKPRMLLLDFVGNCGKHKLCSSADVLGGKYSQEVRDYAAKTIAEEGSAPDALDALDRAEAEWDLLVEEEERRRRIVAEKARYKAMMVNPFLVDQPVETNRAPDVGPARLATNKQVNFLMYLSRRCGLRWNRSEVEMMSKRQAGKLIDDLQTRLKRREEAAADDVRRPVGDPW